MPTFENLEMENKRERKPTLYEMGMRFVAPNYKCTIRHKGRNLIFSIDQIEEFIDVLPYDVYTFNQVCRHFMKCTGVCRSTAGRYIRKYEQEYDKHFPRIDELKFP